MNDFDRSIERVLSGLKDAEAPPEMERRILSALQSHTTAQPTTIWSRLLPPWLGTHARAAALSAACGLAAALIAVLIAPAIRRQNHVPAPTAQKIAPIAQPSQAVVSDAKNAPATQPVLRRVTTHRAIKASLAKTSQTSKIGKASQTSDDLAEIEMRAPSQPAPPMPLTDQEELLLRLVHARDPVELASLDRATFMAQLEKDKAQFDRFFEPPKAAPTTGEAQ